MYQTLHSAGTVFTFYLRMQLKILYSKTSQKLSVCAKAVQKEQVYNKPGTASVLKAPLEQLRAKPVIFCSGPPEPQACFAVSDLVLASITPSVL